MATRRLTTVVAVEGDKAYKQSLSAINSELKSLTSQMRLVTAQFDGQANSTEALKKKSEALRNVIDGQKQKIAVLTSALGNAKNAQSAWADKVTQAQKQLAGTTSAVEKLDAASRKDAETYRTYQNQLSAATDQLKRLETGSGNATEKKEQLKAAIADLTAKMASLEAQTGGEAKANAELLTQQEKLNREMETASGKAATARNAVNRYQTQLNNAKTDLVGMERELTNTNRHLDEAKNSADGCASSIDRFGKETREAGGDSADGAKGVENLGEAVNALGAMLAASGIQRALRAITDSISECIEVSADFGYTMSTVRAVTGASGEDMAALTQQAKDYATSTVYFAQDIADAYATMGRAGFTADEMLASLPGTVALAASSGEDLAAVTSTLADNLTAFGDAAGEAGRYADVLSETAASSNTTVAQLSDAFTMAASTAGGLGYRVEDVAVWLGTMANQGIKGSMAGSAVTTALSRMAGGTKQAAALLEDLGVQMFDAAGNARDLDDFLQDLREAFSGLTQEEAENAATTLAGIRGKKALLTLVNTSKQDWDELTDAINHSSGAAERMADVQLDNYKGQVLLLDSAMEQFKSTIGDHLTPALGDLAEAGTDVLTWATDFLNEHQEIVPVIGGVVTALGTFIGVLSAVTIATKLFNIAVETLGTTFHTSFGKISLIIGAISTAAGLLTAAFTSAADDSDSAAAQVEKAAEEWEKAQKTYEDSMDTIHEEADSVEKLIAELYQLADGTEASAAEQDRIRRIVDELNQKVPELALHYDALTNSMNASSDEARAYADYMAALGEVEAEKSKLDAANDLVGQAQAPMQQAYSDKQASNAAFRDYVAREGLTDEGVIQYQYDIITGDAQKEYDLAQQRMLALRKSQTEAEIAYRKSVEESEKLRADYEKARTARSNRELKELAKNAEDAAGNSMELEYAYESLSTQLTDLKQFGDAENVTLAENALQMLNQRAIVAGLEASYGGLITRTQGSLTELAKALDRSGADAEEWAKRYDETLKGLVNGFKRLETDAGMSLEEMRDNLAYNLEAQQNWNANLDYLMHEAMARHDAAGVALVEQMRAAGIGYAEQVQMMVDDTSYAFDELAPIILEASDNAVATTNREFGYVPTIVGEAANRSVDAFADPFETRQNELKRAMHKAAMEAADGAKETRPEFKAQGGKLTGSMAEGMLSRLPEAKSKIQELLAECKRTIDESSGFYNSGVNAISGFIRGFQSRVSVLSSTVAGIVHLTLDTIRTEGGEHSPWSTTRKSGQFAMEGLTLGMADRMDTALRQAKEATRQVVKCMSGDSVYRPTAATLGASAYYQQQTRQTAPGETERGPQSITTHVYLGNREVAREMTDQVITEINGRITRTRP